jgi:hypothetical protein
MTVDTVLLLQYDRIDNAIDVTLVELEPFCEVSMHGEKYG